MHSPKEAWAPAWTIVWDYYTAAAATLGPTVFVVIWILQRTNGVDKEEERDGTTEKYDHVGNGSQQPFTIIDRPLGSRHFRSDEGL